MSHDQLEPKVRKVRFIPEVTLGNVLQLFAIVGGLGGFMIANEHRMTSMEVKQESFQLQVARLTEATDKLVSVVNRFAYQAQDYSDEPGFPHIKTPKSKP